MEKISMKRGENLIIREEVEQYIRWCKLKSYAEETIEFYNRTIHAFSLYCDIEKPLESLDSKLVENYTLYLREKGLSATTIHCYLRGLKTIITHLMRKGLVQQFDIIAPKGYEAIKAVYTEEELKRLLKKPDIKHCKFEEYRSGAFMEL